MGDLTEAFDVAEPCLCFPARLCVWSLCIGCTFTAWLAMKGKHPVDEIAALPADVKVFHVEQLTVPG